MATGTVSSVTGDVWQTVGTLTSTSGATVTFSGLAGYKKFLLTWKNVATNSNLEAIQMQLNSDSTSGNYVGNLLGVSATYSNSRTNYIPLSVAASAVGIAGFAYIDNVLSASPKPVNGTTSEGNGGYPTELLGMWFGTSAVTSISFVLSSTTFSGGTWTLYGIAA